MDSSTPLPAILERPAYICGCSKAFMSFKALYMHVRGKHSGTYPPRTVIPDRHSIQLSVQKKATLTHQIFAENFGKLVDELADTSPENDWQLSQNSLQEFFSLPVPGFIAESVEMKNALCSIFELHMKGTPNEVGNDFSIFQIFAGFLISILSSARRDTAQEFFALIVMFLGRLLPENASIFSSNFHVIKEGDYMKVADFFNVFLIRDFANLLRNWGTEREPKLLGLDEIKLKNSIYMILMLLDWLFLNGLIPVRFSLDIDLKVEAN